MAVLGLFVFGSWVALIHRLDSLLTPSLDPPRLLLLHRVRRVAIRGSTLVMGMQGLDMAW